MSELARGTVADRPWGRTLGALALQHGVTGTLVLGADNKRYQIAFSQGIVVGAYSPLGSDSAVRVALTAGLVSSTQVNDITRRVQAAPQRDEVEVIAEALRLGPDHSQRLRRRTSAQRAARTFAIERGEWVLDSDMLIPIVPGAELDVRSVVYIGARQNLSEARLAADLAQFGTWFRLLPDVMPDLPQFGFGELEQPVIDCLVTGADLDELEFTGVDMRVVRAMLYSLASCAACEVAAVAPPAQAVARSAPPRASQPPPRPSQPPRSPVTPATDGVQRTPPPARAVPPQQAQSQPPPRSPGPSRQPPPSPTQQPPPPPTQPPAPTRPQPQDSAQGRARGTDGPGRAQSRPSAAPRRPGNPAQVAEVTQLIRQRLEILDGGGDHYALIGVASDASTDQIRKTYFALAHKLHPDRLSALSIEDERRDAHRLFAEVNTAFSILSDPARRNDYTTILRRGGAAAIRREEAQAEEMALRSIEAEEAFRRGEQALRRDQLPQALAEFRRAMELDPNESDYAAMFAWAQFCNAPNRDAAAPQTRTVLEAAIASSPRSITPRYYLGRVERMLGRDQDALRHFKAVLRIAPTHTEAASEVRVIEARIASKR